MIRSIILYFKFYIRRIKNRRIITKSEKALKPSVKKMMEDRIQLRKDLNVFLRKFFNADGKSKYIPPNHKNSAEVQTAIMQEFSERMASLSVKYEDLFK